MNVIMIVADTVVTDYLGVHGGHVHTPNLDRLAAESVDFLSAHAASFPTVPARACYSGELEMVDRWLGRFLDTVDALGLRDDTAVIFTTDHGFCFDEHETFGKMIADRSMDDAGCAAGCAPRCGATSSTCRYSCGCPATPPVQTSGWCPPSTWLPPSRTFSRSRRPRSSWAAPCYRW